MPFRKPEQPQVDCHKSDSPIGKECHKPEQIIKVDDCHLANRPTGMDCHKLDCKTARDLRDIAQRLRIHSIIATKAAKYGSPTPCATIAEILSVVFFRVMRLNINEPLDPASDRLILSKGRAAIALYAAWAEAGLFSPRLLKDVCKVDSNLECFPTPRLNFIDISTGPLGEALSIGAGMAYTGKYIDRASYRTFVIIGNSEIVEGSLWESIHFAAHYKLDNLCIVFEMHESIGETNEEETDPDKYKHRVEMYRDRLDGFGANVVVCDGHDVIDLNRAFHEAEVTEQRPTAIIAKTCRGKDLLKIEGRDICECKYVDDALNRINHLKSLMINDITVRLETLTLKRFPIEKTLALPDLTNIKLTSPPMYKMDQHVSTCAAYGKGLVKIAKANCRIIALDADTRDATFSERLRRPLPRQFIECQMAQQNFIGVAIGVAARDRAIVFASTYASYLTRAFFQIRMGGISQTNANFVGSHCGVSADKDGPSQMGLEDIALFRTIPGSCIFYPSDAVSCERAIELAANTKGMCYIRTSRRDSPVLYENDEIFHIGQCKVIRKSNEDHVLLIGAGVTINECILSANELKRANNINVRIIDPFTIKPLDSETILMHGRLCGGLIVVIEDHYKEGGLGEAVFSALAEHRGFTIKHLYVSAIPRSGPIDPLIETFGISACHISTAIKQIYRR